MKKVSFISACYNVEKHVDGFMTSFLQSDYPDIEMILVNDGSKDGTLEKLRSWVPAIEKRGYTVLIINQENKGLGGAICEGLQHFTGEYLCWMDMDDRIYAQAISKRVEFLETHPDYGLVRMEAKVINGTNSKQTGCVFRGRSQSAPENPWIFDDILMARTLPYPLCYMVRTDRFLEAVPDRKIPYDRVSGPHYMIILPVAYRYACGFIPEPLGEYYVYANSMSRERRTLSGKFLLHDAHLPLMLETISRLPVDQVRYKRMAHQVTQQKKLADAFRKKCFFPAVRPFFRLLFNGGLNRKLAFKFFLLTLMFPVIFWKFN